MRNRGHGFPQRLFPQMYTAFKGITPEIFWVRAKTLYASREYFFIGTKLCHYHLFEDIKTLCMHYQKRSQQYTEEENTFLRCEDLKVSWDLWYPSTWTYYKSKLYKTLNSWSRNMFNFLNPEKRLGLHHILSMTFKEKCFSCYILLTDRM